ncbi:MAG TPA: hypothetical protein VFW29_00380 [Solirubrobacteraceae bacterium]|nr:hypothetical protein [Solirubrobacteraceae bacterium]
MHSPIPTVVLGISENGLSFVVFGTVAFSLVMCVLLLVTRGKDSMYDQIGQGGLSRESDFEDAGASGNHRPADSAAAAAEQEREVRQMLHARSERLVRRGEAPLDIDAEVERLLGSDAPGPGAGGGAAEGERKHDPALAEEVRQLVVARNERRERQGLEPLDVDAEVKRTLSELDP